jgi:hypothetical protein
MLISVDPKLPPLSLFNYAYIIVLSLLPFPPRAKLLNEKKDSLKDDNF